MPVPSTGPISLNDFHVEAGGTSGTQAAINDQDIRDLIGKASGVQMSFSEWYGATAGPNFSAITSPTRNTTTGRHHGSMYLKDEGDGNGDVMLTGALISSRLKWCKFGTNNRISTWSSSATPTIEILPSERYTSGNRAMEPALMGGRKFVVATENWLGYSTGMAVAMYTMNGATSSPVNTSGWTQLFNNQASPVAVLMDPINEGCGVVLNDYTHNYSNYNYTWAFPFKVESNNTISGRSPFQFSNAAGGYRSGLYYDGRIVIRTMSADGRQGYVHNAIMNSSTGAKSSGPTQSIPTATQQYGWASDGCTSEIFCLSGDWFIVYRDDSTYGTDGGQYKISRMTFSGTTITYSNTVNTGLGIGSTERMNFKVGEVASSDSNQIYIANYITSTDGQQTTPTEQVWEWTGSALSKIYEKTGTGLLNSIVGFARNEASYPTPPAQYTADDKVFTQCTTANTAPQVMPFYWSYK